MEFLVLGPLQVRADGGAAVSIAGRQPRALLALLLLEANQPVSADRIATALWGEEAPADSVKAVRVVVSRLRRALDDNVLTTSPAGYRLQVRPGELDSDRFAEFVAEASGALDAGDPLAASGVLRDALSLWRGPALADVAFAGLAQAGVARLEEQRLAAQELRIQAELELGHDSEVIVELQQLVTDHPLRERLHGQLMLALYRSGRQADSVKTFQSVRQALDEQLAVSPGPDLRRLYEAILRQDRSLLRQIEAAPLPPELAFASRAPLAGRSGELARLMTLWETVTRDGQGSTVAIVGPAGIGKTRIAAELAREVARGGAAVRFVTRARSLSAVIASVSSSERATLVVADDVDISNCSLAPLRGVGPRGRHGRRPAGSRRRLR